MTGEETAANGSASQSNAGGAKQAAGAKQPGGAKQAAGAKQPEGVKQAAGAKQNSSGEAETADSEISNDPEILRNIIHELIGERDAAASERDDFKDSLQRLKADFENYKRRVREREQQIAEQASAEFAEKLIPVLEGLEAAMSSDAASAEDRSGMEQIAKLLFSTLEAEGMAALRPEGDLFDPNLHEAVEHIAADHIATDDANASASPDGAPVVVEVFRTGYTWKGRLLRPAMVKVRG